VPFRISGSIRKWWFGDKSLEDFAKFEYEKAINYLFDILDIPKCDWKYFTISGIEVGKNISIKVPCFVVKESTARFKNSCYEMSSYKTGIRFQSKSKKFVAKIYDKVEEISKDFKRKRIREPEENKFLKEHGDKNILRVEYTVSGGKNNVSEQLGFNNIEESIIHFENLYDFFMECSRHFQFCSNVIPTFDARGKKDSEFIDFAIKVLTHVFGIAKVDRMAGQLKYRKMRVRIKRVQENTFGEIGLYGKLAFLHDVQRALLYSMQKSKCLNLVRDVLLKKRAV
jgi:hypothetical protein